MLALDPAARLRRCVSLFAIVSLACLALATEAQAQAQNVAPPSGKGDSAQGEEKRPENGYWSEGEPRFFISSRNEIGAPYFKPYWSVGYGLPHWIWAGIDVNAILTTEVFEVFSGLRLSSPVFDVSYGVRDNWSFSKPFLPQQDHYRSSDEVFNAPGKNARYWAGELEVVGLVPLPYSALVVDFVMNNIFDMPAGKNLYEESYRLITKNATFYVIRFAALARILNEQSLRFGVLVEHGFGTGRLGTVTRVGPILSAQLTDHLQLNAGFTLKVDSPDQLGLTLGAYGVAGIRYYWATGERRPELPWKGKLIPFEGL